MKIYIIGILKIIFGIYSFGGERCFILRGLIHKKIVTQERGILTSHQNFRELNKK